jgi:hypothetical protein
LDARKSDDDDGVIMPKTFCRAILACCLPATFDFLLSLVSRSDFPLVMQEARQELLVVD